MCVFIVLAIYCLTSNVMINFLSGVFIACALFICVFVKGLCVFWINSI